MSAGKESLLLAGAAVMSATEPSYEQLACTEVLPPPAHVLNFLTNPSSMDTTCGPAVTPGPSPCLVSSTAAEEACQSCQHHKTQPTLHVEVCQHGNSSMRQAKLKELVMDMLLERGTAFSELVLMEFDEPTLKDHVLSISITDTPSELKVRWHFQ